MLLFYLAAIEDHNNDQKFINLYRQYGKKIFNIAVKYMANPYDAEDAAQAACFALARNISKIDLKDTEKTKIYIYKAVKHACLNILKTKNKTIEIVNIDNFFDIASTDDLNEIIIENENVTKIENIINNLPKHYKDVLTYHYLNNCSVKEISDLLNRPLYTVKSQLRRGNKLLQDALEEAHIYD